MIDWVTFIDALDEENFETIAMAVHERKKYEAEELAEELVLSFPEVDLIRKGEHHQAIIRINTRLQCGILVAKAAVERQLVLDHEEEEEMMDELENEWEDELDGSPQDESWLSPGEAADDGETVIGIEQPLVD